MKQIRLSFSDGMEENKCPNISVIIAIVFFEFIQ